MNCCAVIVSFLVFACSHPLHAMEISLPIGDSPRLAFWRRPSKQRLPLIIEEQTQAKPKKRLSQDDCRRFKAVIVMAQVKIHDNITRIEEILDVLDKKLEEHSLQKSYNTKIT